MPNYANLNTIKAFIDKDEKNEYNKKYYEKNADKIKEYYKKNYENY